MKTRKLGESAFDAMERIVKILTNTEIDELTQLSAVKVIAYHWAIHLKEIINES